MVGFGSGIVEYDNVKVVSFYYRVLVSELVKVIIVLIS